MTFRYIDRAETVILDEETGKQIPVDPGNTDYAGIVERGDPVASYVDPRTAQEIYDQEVLFPLDKAVLKNSARMVEDFYDALVDQLPQSMKDKHGPLMAERKAKRAARP